jgi:hypothetical protein
MYPFIHADDAASFAAGLEQAGHDRHYYLRECVDHGAYHCMQVLLADWFPTCGHMRYECDALGQHLLHRALNARPTNGLMTAQTRENIVRLLLENGADPNATSLKGIPLDMIHDAPLLLRAEQATRLGKLLIDYGAQVERRVWRAIKTQIFTAWVAYGAARRQAMAQRRRACGALMRGVIALGVPKDVARMLGRACYGDVRLGWKSWLAE